MSGWLTVAAVAEEFDVSARTVQRWIKQGDLAAIQLPGGDLRIATNEVGMCVRRWSTIAPDNAGGPAVREHPGPGTEV